MKTLFIILLGLSMLHAKSFEQAFNIQTITPKVVSHSVSKSYYAMTSYDEAKIYDLTIRFDGYIKNLRANELYKNIKKGEKLFDIYSKEIYTLQNELRSSRNFPALQTTILEKLKLYELGEKISLLEDETVPFYSRYDGHIIEKNVNEGSFVKAGSRLYKIADSSSMWVIAKVYQKDKGFIQQGMLVRVMIEGLDKPIEAKVNKIYPKINEKDLTFDVRIDLLNPNGEIFPNMFAKVEMRQKETQMLMLPKDAVIKRGEKFYVFMKVASDEYMPNEIEAEYVGGSYRVLSGLDVQAQVAKNALFLLDSDAVTNGSYMSEEW